jgi:iron complex transport system substrate-binding protein
VAAPYPSRIVCLTEEPTETLYRIGAGDRIVGISGFTVRPPEARATKPKISTFLDAQYEEIVALEPDLVIGFSDLQAEIARELVRRGVAVCIFNQRSIEEILQVVRATGALVGRAAAAEALAAELEANVARARTDASRLPRRPRVFFEEWDDPLICGIRWVSELIEAVGGEDVCRESRREKGARGRVYDPAEIARRDPEAVIASWCGKKVRPERIRARPGWEHVRAVRDGRIYEIDASIILQPGPAALTDGLAELARIVREAAGAAAG